VNTIIETICVITNQNFVESKAQYYAH